MLSFGSTSRIDVNQLMFRLKIESALFVSISFDFLLTEVNGKRPNRLYRIVLLHFIVNLDVYLEFSVILKTSNTEVILQTNLLRINSFYSTR